MKKRVLHIINNLGSGGAENMLIQFVQNAKHHQEFEFKILLLENDTISFSLSDQISIEKLPTTKSRFSLIKLYYLYKYLKNNKFDLVHVHLFPSQYYVAFLRPFFRNIKFITTEHNTTNSRRNYLITRIIDKMIYRQFDKIIFISEGAKKQFMKDFKISNCKKGLVITNGITLSKFKVSKEKRQNDEIKLIMVARFSEQKDHETLIKALKLLPENYTLTLVGEGPNQVKVKNLVTQLKLSHKVHFLGFRNDVPHIYSQHDIFILSSHWEGFGLVAVEAMASGLPVIASRVDGLKEVVRDTGILFTPKNYQELAKHILSITKDKVRYQEMSIKGLEKAQEYDINFLVNQTLNLYKNILNEL